MTAASGLVVIVDRFVDAADSLQLLLESDGFEVLAAYAGKSGFHLIEDMQPFAAIIELRMSDFDGRTLARAVRRLPWGADIFLVALTADATQSEQREILEAGFDECIIKPGNIDRLLASLHRAAESRS